MFAIMHIVYVVFYKKLCTIKPGDLLIHGPSLTLHNKKTLKRTAGVIGCLVHCDSPNPSHSTWAAKSTISRGFLHRDVMKSSRLIIPSSSVSSKRNI